jgi:hypothetical protein
MEEVIGSNPIFSTTGLSLGRAKCSFPQISLIGSHADARRFRAAQRFISGNLRAFNLRDLRDKDFKSN